jgi:hypothetical protein
VLVVNKWLRRISAEIELSYPHCGPQSIESMEHKFFDCPLTQKVWRYAANIIWQLFSKRRKFGSQKSSSMMQCLLDQPLGISLKPFSHIWFLLKRSSMDYLVLMK